MIPKIRLIFICCSILSAQFSFSQFVDDFSDGDFENNPTWTGQKERFVVTAGELQLMAPAVEEASYLVTESAGLDNGVWEFSVRMNFATSSTSFTKVYLMTTQEDLSGPLNGYYVLIGETEDEISLFRQDGSADVVLIDGVDKSIATSSVNVRVRVTRDSDGNWELLHDVSGGTNFVSEGNATDLTYTFTSFFGLYCQYTQSRSDDFFFDNITVTGSPILDTDPPLIASVEAINQTVVSLVFSEPLDPASVQSTDFMIDQGVSVSMVNVSEDMVTLTTTPMTNGRTYSITVNDLTDERANVIAANSEAEFRYLVFADPEYGDLLLSEVLFNPKTGGPDFVELYNNTTDKFFNLLDFKFARIDEGELDQINEIAELELVMEPGRYFAFTEDREALLFDYPSAEPSNVLTIDDLPTYTDNEGTVVLLNPLLDTLQFFEYNEDFHFDLLEDEEGVSLERISFVGTENDRNVWRSASSQEGFATPGKSNSQTISALTPSVNITIEPKVFIPGNAGMGRDFTTIRYEMNGPGKFANVTIYDQSGRIINQLANGESLSTVGFFRWDGTTSSGSMANMGYHIVVFELYDSSGTVETLRETIVVGRDF